MLYLLLFALGLGVIMFPFILYWEIGSPLIITAPLWYIVLPALFIYWISKSGEKEREALGTQLLPGEKGAASIAGKELYKQFIENCVKCSMFADGSIHVVVRACGKQGEWLNKDSRPEYFAFELTYTGPVIMSVFEDSHGCYEPYTDGRHENAKPNDISLRVIWAKYIIAEDEKSDNSKKLLRYFAYLTNYYVRKSASDEKYSFMHGKKVEMMSMNSSKMLQFFIS